MDTLIFRKKLSASKEITINLPQLNAGDEVALIVVYSQMKKSERQRFDLDLWAEKWATDLGDTVQSTDVESCTGRSF